MIEEIKNTIGKREIEFRFWSNENMQFVDTPILNRKGSIFQLGSEGKGKDPLKDYCLMLSPWSKLVKMQYTGFTDDNGKKIFEGDIVITRYGGGSVIKQGVVYFDTALGSWEIKIKFLTGEGQISLRKSYLSLHPKREDYGVCEIIGNIYENPELLKK